MGGRDGLRTHRSLTARAALSRGESPSNSQLRTPRATSRGGVTKSQSRSRPPPPNRRLTTQVDLSDESTASPSDAEPEQVTQVPVPSVESPEKQCALLHDDELPYHIEYSAKLDKEVLKSIRIRRHDFLYPVQRMDARERAQKIAGKRKRDIADNHTCVAKISAYKISAYNLTIEGNHIREIDKTVRDLLDRKARDLRVQVTLQLYTAERDGDSTSSSERQMKQRSHKKNKGKKQRTSKTPRSTATTLMRSKEAANKDRDRALDLSAVELIALNRCKYELNNCPNKSAVCIQWRENDHVKLNSILLREWQKAIRKRKATKTSPPEKLMLRAVGGQQAAADVKKLKGR